MKRFLQILSIGIAAYNLYVVVNDFLETPAGEKVKEKISEYVEKAKPYVEEASDYASELVGKVVDRIEEKKAGVV